MPAVVSVFFFVLRRDAMLEEVSPRGARMARHGGVAHAKGSKGEEGPSKLQEGQRAWHSALAKAVEGGALCMRHPWRLDLYGGARGAGARALLKSNGRRSPRGRPAPARWVGVLFLRKHNAAH